MMLEYNCRICDAAVVVVVVVLARAQPIRAAASGHFRAYQDICVLASVVQM
jgi:hypothetical protein